MTFLWVLVSMLTENPHHLSDAENTSLELEGNIRVGNGLEIHIVKKYKGIWVHFTLKRGLFSNIEEITGSLFSASTKNEKKGNEKCGRFMVNIR